jgi:hypothetical protein
MKQWFKDFLSSTNEINEHTVVGMIYTMAFLCVVFIKPLNIGFEVKALIGGMSLTCFGLSLGKK